jgi:hypothetical protein
MEQKEHMEQMEHMEQKEHMEHKEQIMMPSPRDQNLSLHHE